MKFNIFGDSANEAIVLIHGELMPWQMWHREIQLLQRNYFVIVPILNAHDEDGASDFTSIKNEARSIENFILKTHDGNVFALCGAFMGGVIANYIFGNGRVSAKKLILDNTSLIPANLFKASQKKNSFITLVQRLKERDRKTLEAFAEERLPKEYFENLLPFIDTMSEASAKNIAKSLCRGKLVKNGDKQTEILFLYGNESDFSVKRSAAKIKKRYPAAKTTEFIYYNCFMHTYETDKWLMAIYDFLKGQS